MSQLLIPSPSQAQKKGGEFYVELITPIHRKRNGLEDLKETSHKISEMMALGNVKQMLFGFQKVCILFTTVSFYI
jgi:hypothetical protein